MQATDTAREVEAAYRRGFMQGAYMAHFQQCDGFTPAQLHAWRMSLENWRFNLRFEKTPDFKSTSWPHWTCPPERFMKGKK